MSVHTQGYVLILILIFQFAWQYASQSHVAADRRICPIVIEILVAGNVGGHKAFLPKPPNQRGLHLISSEMSE
jgi:hypothetical protein